MEVTILYNLILEVASHYFCHILLVRSESLSLACILKERLTQGMNTSMQRTLGPCESLPAIIPYIYMNHYQERTRGKAYLKKV